MLTPERLSQHGAAWRAIGLSARERGDAAAVMVAQLALIATMAALEFVLSPKEANTEEKS